MCPIPILKSGGQMGQCPVQGQPELFVSIQIQMQRCQAGPFTSLSFSFIIVKGGKQCPSLRLVRLQGSYSWGSRNNTVAYSCFQKSRLPTLESWEDVPCSVVLPRLTLTYNRPLFLMLSPWPHLEVFSIFHLDLLTAFFFFWEILTNWFLTYKIWECPREAAQLKQMKMESGNSQGKVKINDA